MRKSFLCLCIILLNIAATGQKLRTVNVKDFGAKGDGKQDDTKFIQSALDAVIGTGGIVYFPAGAYTISNNLYLYYKSDVSLEMRGQKNAIIYPNAKRYYIFCNNGNKRTKPFGSLKIEGLTIDGSRLPFPQSHYYDDASPAYGVFTTNLKNILIQNSEFRNIYGSALNLILMKELDDTTMKTSVIVKNNRIINCWGLNPTKDYYDKKDSSKTAYDNYGDGIAIWGYRNAVIDHNYVYNDVSKTKFLGRGGIVIENDGANARITNNIIHGYDRNIHIEVDRGGHLIANNKISGSNVGIYFWLAYNWANKPTVIENNTFSYNNEIEKYKLKTLVGGRKYISINGTGTTTYQGTIIKNNVFLQSPKDKQVLRVPNNLKVLSSRNSIK